MKKRPKIAAANVAAAMMLTQQGSLNRGIMKIKTQIKTIQTVRIGKQEKLVGNPPVWVSGISGKIL